MGVPCPISQIVLRTASIPAALDPNWKNFAETPDFRTLDLVARKQFFYTPWRNKIHQALRVTVAEISSFTYYVVT